MYIQFQKYIHAKWALQRRVAETIPLHRIQFIFFIQTIQIKQRLFRQNPNELK